jgi:hypothetical protein
MIAIKDMEMPKSCVRCFTKGLRGLVGCELLLDDNNICVETRHPDCPLKEIVTCKDCKHWIKNRYCYKHTPQVITYESDFCNYGERRE